MQGNDLILHGVLTVVVSSFREMGDYLIMGTRGVKSCDCVSTHLAVGVWGHAILENLYFVDSLRSLLVHSQVLIRLWSEEHVAIYYKLQEAFPRNCMYSVVICPPSKNEAPSVCNYSH